MTSCQCHWALLTTALYGLATVFTLFSALSLPYAPAPTAYIVGIQFNGNMFNGTVNEIPVEQLTAIRLGVWTACYYDNLNLENPRCLVTGIGYIPYKVTIALENGKFMSTIIQPWWTGGLLISLLPLVLTASTLIVTLLSLLCGNLLCPCCYKRGYWCEYSALGLTVVLGIPYLALFVLVKNEMQTLGEDIVTYPGPAFSLAGLTVISLLIGLGLRFYFINDLENQNKGGGKATEKVTRVFYNSAAAKPVMPESDG